MPVLTVTLIVLAWVPVSAGPPTERLRGFFTKVNAVLADPTTEQQPIERIARIRRLVTDITDIPSAAAAALGSEWAARTAAERDEFTDLFAELLERAYVGRLAGTVRVTGAVAMTYVDEAVEGDTSRVTTALRGTDGHVEYRMMLRGGRWQVHDVVLDGVSVVENYRAQFRRLMQQESYAAVVTAMRAKLAAESLLFAGLPRWAPRVAATPRPEHEVVAATPPSPVVTPPPSSPRPAVEPVVRRAVRAAPAFASSPPTPAPHPAAPLAVATSNVVVPSAVRVVSVPAPKAPETSLGIALGAVLLALAAMGGAAYLRRR